MSFFSDVKFLANLFRSKKILFDLAEEYQKECEELKEKIIGVKGDVTLREKELEDLANKKDVITEKVKTMSSKVDEITQRFNQSESKVNMLHQLESIEFVDTVIKEKGYQLKKLDISMEVESDYVYDEWSYYKPDFLKVINFKIQEFAAKESVSYEKIKTALYDVNAAWFECYDSGNYDWVKEGGVESVLLTTSFLIPVKNKSTKK